MAITPADIQAQTFSEAKRGYDPAEVDVFLETLSSEVGVAPDKFIGMFFGVPRLSILRVV